MEWAEVGWERRGGNSLVLKSYDSERCLTQDWLSKRDFLALTPKAARWRCCRVYHRRPLMRTFSLLRQSRSWRYKQAVWSNAAPAFIVLGSSEARASEARGAMLVLESIQQRAFGFLHLTRSPRHGMHSSARQRAFWMPEKQQLVRATDAKRGHGFLFLCFEWRPWRHNSKEPLEGQITRRRPRAFGSVVGLL